MNCDRCGTGPIPYNFSLCQSCLGVSSINHCVVCKRVSFLDSGFCQSHWYEEFNKDVYTHQFKERLIRWDLFSYFLKKYTILLKYDVTIPNSSLKYRPDIHFEYHNCLFIIEIDEYAHNGRMENDLIRDRDIFTTLIGQYQQIFIIRINPDRTESGRKAIANRVRHIIGPGVVKTSMEVDFEELTYRLDVLKQLFLNIVNKLLLGQKNCKGRVLLFY